MAVTYGFFNSINGDRTYNADDFNGIFDGLMSEGVYKNFGTSFAVTPGSGLSVNVGSGRARLARKWIYNSNSTNFQLESSASGVLPTAICIMVDDTNRICDIVTYKGRTNQSTYDLIRELKSNFDPYYYPIAVVRVPEDATSISQSDIEKTIRNDSSYYTPYIEELIDRTLLTTDEYNDILSVLS